MILRGYNHQIKEGDNMKNTFNTRKGFTLVEIVCVIAIIVLFTTVFASSAKDYFGSARLAADDAAAHDQANVNVEDDVKAYLKGYTRNTAPRTSPTGNSNQVPGPASPDAGGGGTPGVSAEPIASNPPPQTTTTQEQTTTTETTLPPTASQDTSGGGAGGQGNNGGSGAVSAPNGTVTSGQGVVSIVPSANGNSYSVKIQKSEWETLNLTITVENGKFVLHIGDGTGGGKWILDQNIFKDLYKTDTYTLTQAQIDYLANTFGLVLG